MLKSQRELAGKPAGSTRMTLQNEELVEHGDNPASGKFAVNVIFREHTEDGATYVVAECMEIPGCVSEGNTKQEAAANLEAAMKLCLGVLFEDCVRLKRGRWTRKASPPRSGCVATLRLSYSTHKWACLTSHVQVARSISASSNPLVGTPGETAITSSLLIRAISA